MTNLRRLQRVILTKDYCDDDLAYKHSAGEEGFVVVPQAGDSRCRVRVKTDTIVDDQSAFKVMENDKS